MFDVPQGVREGSGRETTVCTTRRGSEKVRTGPVWRQGPGGRPEYSRVHRRDFPVKFRVGGWDHWGRLRGREVTRRLRHGDRYHSYPRQDGGDVDPTSHGYTRTSPMWHCGRTCVHRSDTEESGDRCVPWSRSGYHPFYVVLTVSGTQETGGRNR